MNVTLSKSAWHFRLQRFSFGSIYVYDNWIEDRSFCQYIMWTTLALILFPISALGSTVPYVNSGEFFDSRRYKSNFETGTILFARLFCASILITIFIMCFIVIGSVKIVLFVLTLTSTVLVYKTSDLWMSYAESVKKRICPVIKWKE